MKKVTWFYKKKETGQVSSLQANFYNLNSLEEPHDNNLKMFFIFIANLFMVTSIPSLNHELLESKGHVFISVCSMPNSIIWLNE